MAKMSFHVPASVDSADPTISESGTGSSRISKERRIRTRQEKQERKQSAYYICIYKLSCSVLLRHFTSHIPYLWPMRSLQIENIKKQSWLTVVVRAVYSQIEIAFRVRYSQCCLVCVLPCRFCQKLFRVWSVWRGSFLTLSRYCLVIWFGSTDFQWSAYLAS